VVAANIINYVTRGHSTFENPEDGLSSKLSAWIPSLDGKGPGVFLNPLGLAMPFLKQITGYLEKTGNAVETAERYAKAKGGAIPQAIMAAVQQASKTHSTMDALGAAGEALLPIPISGGAVASAFRSTQHGQMMEQYKGQIESQIGKSMGMDVEPAPSPDVRLSVAAKNFLASHPSKTGVTKEKQENLPPGDYQELTQALRQDDPDRAEAAMKLLAKKHEAASVAKYYAHYPRYLYTGSRSTESAFIRQLTPEQKGKYEEARKERQEITKRFNEQFAKKLHTYYQ
jgi:hypothetical protein